MMKPFDSRYYRNRAFTLVELLIVLVIFLALAAIALPTVRTLIAGQKVANASRDIVAYFNVARARAVATGRPAGVMIERFDTRTLGAGGDPFGRSFSIRLRQLNGAPAYSGDASNARGVVLPGGNQIQFAANDNQLLALSQSLVFNATATLTKVEIERQSRSPIQNDDLLELPGGVTLPFRFANPDSTTDPVVLNLRNVDPVLLPDGSLTSTQRFPSMANTAAGVVTQRPIKYRIYRRPSVSSSAPLNLPRGVAIDMNYSGFGASGNEFAPVGASANHIQIVFGPSGKVIGVHGLANQSVTPTGLVFLCLGDTDGVRPDGLLSTENKAVANVVNPDTLWIVINPSTGRVVASPSAVSNFGSDNDATISTSDAAVLTAITASRQLALFSDTVAE